MTASIRARRAGTVISLHAFKLARGLCVCLILAGRARTPPPRPPPMPLRWPYRAGDASDLESPTWVEHEHLLQSAVVRVVLTAPLEDLELLPFLST